MGTARMGEPQLGHCPGFLTLPSCVSSRRWDTSGGTPPLDSLEGGDLFIDGIFRRGKDDISSNVPHSIRPISRWAPAPSPACWFCREDSGAPPHPQAQDHPKQTPVYTTLL